MIRLLTAAWTDICLIRILLLVPSSSRLNCSVRFETLLSRNTQISLSNPFLYIMSYILHHTKLYYIILYSYFITGDNTNKRINMDWFFDRIVRDRVVPIPGTYSALCLLHSISSPYFLLPTFFLLPPSPISFPLSPTSFTLLPSPYLLPSSNITLFLLNFTFLHHIPLKIRIRVFGLFGRDFL